MAKQKENSTSTFVTVFVGVILGLVLLSALAGVILTSVQLTQVTNESINIASANNIDGKSMNTSVVFTLANAPTGWRQSDTSTYLSSVVVRNNSGATLTLTTDYLINLNNGTLTLKNTTSTYNPSANKTYVDYKYAGSDYQPVDWSRSILGLITGLLALGVLVYVIVWATKQFEEVE